MLGWREPNRACWSHKIEEPGKVSEFREARHLEFEGQMWLRSLPWHRFDPQSRILHVMGSANQKKKNLWVKVPKKKKLIESELRDLKSAISGSPYMFG